MLSAVTELEGSSLTNPSLTFLVRAGWERPASRQKAVPVWKLETTGGNEVPSCGHGTTLQALSHLSVTCGACDGHTARDQQESRDVGSRGRSSEESSHPAAHSGKWGKEQGPIDLREVSLLAEGPSLGQHSLGGRGTSVVSDRS